jgi:hypothetical protein
MFMMGVIVSEIVGFNRALWRSLSLDVYALRANMSETLLDR